MLLYYAGNFYYGNGHPMKPHRVRMTHSLVLAYGLYKKMEVYRPPELTEEQMMKFHSADYVHCLQMANPDNMEQYAHELKRFNLNVDCPIFDGLFKYCQLYAGGSVAGAYKLNQQSSDVVVNWAG